MKINRKMAAALKILEDQGFKITMIRQVDVFLFIANTETCEIHLHIQKYNNKIIKMFHKGLHLL
jgi:hypothetical protein